MKNTNYNLCALYKASSFPCEAYALIAYSESKGEVPEEIIEKMLGSEYINFLKREEDHILIINH